MKSWRTTIWGAIAAAASAVAVGGFSAEVTKIALCISAAANGVGLCFARDQKQSEQENQNKDQKKTE